MNAGGGEYELTHDQLFSLEEQKLFTRSLEIAEKKGKTIHLAVAAATDKWEAILRAAQSLQSSAVALGASPNTTVVEDARIAGLAWERLPDPKPQLALQFYFPSGQDQIFYLGPHAPHLTPKEIDLLHGIWLELSSEVAPEEIHHHDVVHFALEELHHELQNLWAPPPSSRQYQSAKTRTFVTQSSAPDSSKRNGGSLCVGKVVTNRKTEKRVTSRAVSHNRRGK